MENTLTDPSPSPAEIDRWLAGMLANYAMFNGFVPVHNSDFRDWQRKHRTGGDFFVFSDVKWVQPNVDHVVL